MERCSLQPKATILEYMAGAVEAINKYIHYIHYGYNIHRGLKMSKKTKNIMGVGLLAVGLGLSVCTANDASIIGSVLSGAATGNPNLSQEERAAEAAYQISENKAMREAAQAGRGEVNVYNDQLIDLDYETKSGGHYKGQGIRSGNGYTPHGFGTYTWANGEKYIGEFRNSVPDGQGTYTYPNGEKYIGEFRNGKKEGQGTFTWVDGKKYVGEWKNDVREGQGTYTWANGKKYVGEYRNNVPDGQGTFTWADGAKYVGEFRNGKKEGQGTLTLPDGKKYVGEWRNDKKVKEH